MFAAFALATAAASTPDRFDLICGRDHFRVDLAAMEWCAGSCENINRIAAVTSGTLTLSDRQPISSSLMSIEVSRVTGERHLWTLGRFPVDIRDQCSVAPFTSFPTAQRKF